MLIRSMRASRLRLNVQSSSSSFSSQVVVVEIAECCAGRVENVESPGTEFSVLTYIPIINASRNNSLRNTSRRSSSRCDGDANFIMFGASCWVWFIRTCGNTLHSSQLDKQHYQGRRRGWGQEMEFCSVDPVLGFAMCWCLCACGWERMANCSSSRPPTRNSTEIRPHTGEIID